MANPLGFLYNINLFLQKVNFHLRKVYRPFKKLIDYTYLSYHGIDTRYGYVHLIGFPKIFKAKTAKIIIGQNCTLVSKTKGNCAGINHQVILAAISDKAEIIIKGNFGASGSAIVAANKIIIEMGAGLGANSHIYDTDFHPIPFTSSNPIKSSPVYIGRDVWVAANCLVLKGVTIGDRSIVAAGSVVNQNIPTGYIAAGIPAVAKKQI